MMRTILCVVMILLVFSGCSKAPDRMADPIQISSEKPGAMTVVTFNIRYGTAKDGENRWENRKQLVFDLLGDYGADVIDLQEALDFQIDQIHQALPQYEVIYVCRDDGLRVGEACPILYRRDRFERINSDTFWFSDTPRLPGSRSWGNDIPRICTWVHLKDRVAGKNFYVYNLHLDHLSQASREKSTEMLSDRIRRRSDRDPYIVTGDFNIGMDNPAMRFLRREQGEKTSLRLVDTWQMVHPGQEPVGTFHGFSGNSTSAKIDHILVTGQTKVLEADIDQRSFEGRYPSDHFPVFAVIQLPGF